MSVLKDYMTVTFMLSAQTILAVMTVHVLLAILEMDFPVVCQNISFWQKYKVGVNLRL